MRLDAEVGGGWRGEEGFRVRWVDGDCGVVPDVNIGWLAGRCRGHRGGFPGFKGCAKGTPAREIALCGNNHCDG